MIGAFIVFLVAVAIVAAYIITVNRFLRSDEHWDEPNAVSAPPASRSARPAPEGLVSAKV